MPQAQLDRAQFVDQVQEALEVRDRAAVELDVGEVRDRLGGVLERLAPVLGVGERLSELRLIGGDAAGDLHQQVARQRDEADLGEVLVDVDDDVGVGAGHALVAHPRVRAQHQEVERPFDVRALLAVDALVAEEILGLHGVVHEVQADLRGERAAAGDDHHYRTGDHHRLRPPGGRRPGRMLDRLAHYYSQGYPVSVRGTRADQWWGCIGPAP